MKRMRLAIGLCLAAMLGSCATPPPAPPPAVDPGALAFDPAVIRGVLDNGLRYLVRENARPEGRLELRLVVDVGSVLEDDDQQGLAHFVEHMAFNGTEHFAKSELVDYLESIGMTFGPDLNAYTGFDETVYMLQVPTDDASVVRTAFRILADWAGGMTLEGEEIEKERGVVIEEWRGRRGAQQRIRDRQLPVLLKNSRYAERLPIGKKEILDTFSHEAVRRFYREWYRPEVMTVIVVGDADPAGIVDLVREHFGPLSNPEGAVPRESFPVPDQPDRRVSIVTDPEATSTTLTAYYLRPVDRLQTRPDYRRALRDDLFNTMLNLRFAEMVKKPDPPFLSAYAFKGNLIRTKGVFALGAEVEDEGLARGLEALLAEAERLKRHGFTPGEAARARAMSLRAAQVAYNERARTESAAFAEQYVSSVTNDEISPGVEAGLRMHEEMLETITLAELNGLIADWITETNCVVLASGPEKPGLALPDEGVLAGIFDTVATVPLDPYVDDVAEGPLVPELPSPGRVTEKTAIEELGVEVWTLSNGIRMLLKPTEFKADEILLVAVSPGGHSRVALSSFIPGSSAAGVVQEGGAGGFSKVQLEKKLAGKVVQVEPYIEDLQEGVRGACSPEDLDTLMALVHLTFTRPRADPEAFAALQDRQRAELENRLANPRAVFSDRVTEVMSQNHPRRKPWTPNTVNRMDLAESMDIYRQRFADGDDFTFVFVGNLDLAEMERLAAVYLASLPVEEGDETWVDRNIRYPDGAVSLDVRRGIDDKAQVVLAFWGPMDWNVRQRHLLRSLAEALRIRLRETVREDLGGTYGVGVGAQPIHYPESQYLFQIGFGCDPARLEDLVGVVRGELEKLKADLLDETYLVKIREGQLRQRERDLKENSFWLGTLEFHEWHGEDPRVVLEFEETVRGLTAEDIRSAARAFLDTPNQALFTLRPENGPAAGADD